jgi:spore coat polysaccharide biosynthesis predicted glycosyltransferase SpsG
VSRCIALAEELQSRGFSVEFASDLAGSSWAVKQASDRGIDLLPPINDPLRLQIVARERDWAGFVVDSYVADPRLALAFHDLGRPALVIVDGDLRGQVGDLYVDQNLDSEKLAPPIPRGATRLAGLRYALLRDQIRSRRPPAPPIGGGSGEVPHVVGFFGGTDPFGAAETVAPLLLAASPGLSVTFVSPWQTVAERLLQLERSAGQRIEVIQPVDDLPALVMDADLVISAAGTSLWEMMCLGIPSAVISVADNQALGYRAVVSHGLAVGLGSLGSLRHKQSARDQAVAALRRLVIDTRLRTDLAKRAWRLVDGLGRERVVNAFGRLID